VLVGDDEGNAIKGVTVEFLLADHTLPNCYDHSPAKQVGLGRKFKFKFRSYENGYPEVLLRVTAPGYVAYEEKGVVVQTMTQVHNQPHARKLI
jgi:hypothetical protein